MKIKKKADAAIKEYSKKEKPKKNIVIKSNNTVATDDELKEIESILKEDVDTGFMAWSQLLYRIMAANRISKEMLKRCMDRIVWNIRNYELYDGDGLIPVSYKHLNKNSHCAPTRLQFH